MAKAVLVDITRCSACRSCQVACKQWNELPAEPTAFTGGDNPLDLSARTWSRVSFHTVTLPDGTPGRRWVKNQCMHCVDPACVSACPVSAMTKTPEGPVVYDWERCFGCRYCMVACPFSVPSFEWDKPLSLVRKCDMCYERIVAGLEPACVAACPNGALAYGTRDELLALAEQRIAAHPDRYVHHVYGRDEVGGTSWMYLSDVPFDDIGLDTGVVRRPVPEFTHAAMGAVPWIAAVGALTFSGLAWYTRRRAENAAKEE